MSEGLTLPQKFRVHAALSPDGLTARLTQAEAMALARMVEQQEQYRLALKLLEDRTERTDMALIQLRAAQRRLDAVAEWFMRLSVFLALFWCAVAWAGWL